MDNTAWTVETVIHGYKNLKIRISNVKDSESRSFFGRRNVNALSQPQVARSVRVWCVQCFLPKFEV